MKALHFRQKPCADNDSWDDATIAERYSGEVGEEWKERLSAKVEGKEYVPGQRSTPSINSSSRSQTPIGSRNRTDSPARPSGAVGVGNRAKVDDKYFAGLGAANANRPEDLPPSQGGKYGGFGSAPIERPSQERALPGLDDLQKDPLAAIGKGFGWFTSTVGKTAKTVNDSYIQPTARQVQAPPPTYIPVSQRRGHRHHRWRGSADDSP